MKRQILTKQDIQKDLLAKINKSKGFIIILTVFSILSIILFSVYLINYLNYIHLEDTSFHNLNTTTQIIFVALITMVFPVITFFAYYDLYKIKKGKYEIKEDTLLDKDEVRVNRYRARSIILKVLFFSCGKISVEDDVYSYTKAGDKFYVVIINNKINVFHPLGDHSPLRLAYHKKYYEINLD